MRVSGSDLQYGVAPVRTRDTRTTKPLTKEQHFLTSADLARRLRRKGTKSTERNLRAGKFPGAFQDGRVWLLRESDFEKWVESRIARAAQL